jgi:hypothetical protein
MHSQPESTPTCSAVGNPEIEGRFGKSRIRNSSHHEGERLTDSQPTNVLAAGKIWHTGGTQITIVF